MSSYIINKSELIQNIETIKNKAGVPIIGVVKGNGYGFGLKEFTLVLKENGIKTFAITEVNDIATLKSILDSEDVLVMRSTCVEEEAKIIAENHCIATIGSLEAAEIMDKISANLGVKTKCHLKIDTGMSRYGFTPNQFDEILKCYEFQNLEFCGVYTHFSSAFRNYDLTKKQLNIFKELTNKLTEKGIKIGVRHASNSPALLNVDGVTLDMVRIGSAFTGRVITKNENTLNRIGILEAPVIEIKSIKAGTSIGYNGSFVATNDMKIAIIPVGHYDGFGLTKEKEIYDFRSVLSSAKAFTQKRQISLKINDKQYNVVGEIGLSHTVIDITNSDVKIGDKAKIDVNPLMVNPMIPRVYC